MRLRTWLAGAAAALLQACVYVPRTTEAYDPDCRVVSRQMVLEEVQVGSISRCTNEGCAALIVAAGIAAAASAVVSGSIVVAGNVVYWLERRGLCRKDS